MRKLIFICLLLTNVWQISAQNDKISNLKKIKGFNSPSNYAGYRPLYKDTLYIDFGQGQKMEFIYNWSTLFGENEDKYQMFFWLPFSSQFRMLQTKIKELPLSEGAKYLISIDSKKIPNLSSISVNRYKDQHVITKEVDKNTNHNPDSIMPYYHDKISYKDSLVKVQTDFLKKLYQKKLTISVKTRKTNNEHREYIIKNGELVGRTQWQHILEIKNLTWKVRLYVNDINDLSVFNNVDLNRFIRSERYSFIRHRFFKYHTCLNYKVEDGEVKHQPALFERKRKRTRFKAFHISPTVGTSIVKGNWSTDLGVLMGVTFNDKQNSAVRLGLRYQLKGFGLDEINVSRIKYNGFVDGIMDLNIGTNYKREQWVGAGLGFLTHQSGTIYGKNTGRIFFKYRSSKLWGVQPEFNYSFNDNKGFIALGLFFSL